MSRLLTSALLVLTLAWTAAAATRRSAAAKHHTSAVRCIGCERDTKGRIKRSQAAIQQFRKVNPCPATARATGACPGYQIDHSVPLHRGGADTPDNMQWLSTEQHHAKTSREAAEDARSGPAMITPAATNSGTKARGGGPKTIYTGPRGGRFHYSSSGKKVYERRK